MKTDRCPTTAIEDILAEVWKLKDENAAQYGYDIQAIARAAREHQESHPDRIVSLESPTENSK